MEAARSEDDCCCDVGFYMLRSSNGANTTESRECVRCKDEASCDEPGIELLTLPAKPGYWRVSGTSTSLLRCPTPDACAGGSICSANSTAAATCDEQSSNQCAKNHRGPLCQNCVEGHYKPTRAGLCVSCNSPTSAASYGAAGGLAFAFISAAVLICLFVRHRRRREDAKKKKQNARSNAVVSPAARTLRQVLWRRLFSESLRNKFKLVISLFQVVGSFDLIFDGKSESNTVPSSIC
jgi:hypothetical protein